MNTKYNFYFLKKITFFFLTRVDAKQNGLISSETQSTKSDATQNHSTAFTNKRPLWKELRL